MAYQPKSYRKFLVGAVSTAVVASSFAGVAGAAANFTDVNSNYKEAVDFLVSKGISGISTTEFGTYQNIKRVDAAVFVVKALGLDVNAAPASGFTDVPDRAAKEVNALKAAGITSGKSATEFGAQDLITRGELAIWLDKAFDLKGEGDVSAFTDANGIYTDAIKALVANNITKGTSATTFGTKDPAKRGDFAVFVKKAADTLKEEVVTPAVKSVNVINAKQIQVTFTQPVDEDSVIETGTPDTLVDGALELSRLPLASDDKDVDIDNALAELSGDQKTLTITASGTEYFEGNYAVAVTSEVRAASGESIEAYTGTFNAAEDKTAPTVKDVVYNPSTGLVKVALSEPVEVNPTVTVNNGAPETLTANDTNTEFTFAPTAEAGETISVAVNGAIDFKDNDQVSATKSVKIAYEESMIQVTSVKQTSSNEVTIVFDKALAKAGDEATVATQIQTDLTVLRDGIAQSGVVAFDTDDETNRTITVTFNGGIAPDYSVYPEGKDTAALTFVFGAETLTDVFGNTNDAITKTISLTKDETAPKLLNTRLSADKKSLELIFDEDVTVDSAAGLSVRKGGVVVSAAAGIEGFRVAAASTSDKVLTIPYQNGLDAATSIPAGDYTVYLAKDTISDAHDNQNTAFNSTAVKVENSDTFSAVAFTGVTPLGTNEYQLAFTGGALGDSALLPSSYTLNGAALPANTDIVFTDADKDTVNIKLPADSINYTSPTAPLRAINVKDNSGVKVQPAQYNVTVTDNIKPVLTAATLSGNTLTLTYSEDMLSTLATTTDLADIITDLEIKGNATELDDFSANDDVVTTVDGKNVTFTFTNTASTDNNWNLVKAASKITVKVIDDTLIADVNSTVQKLDTVVTVVKK